MTAVSAPPDGDADIADRLRAFLASQIGDGSGVEITSVERVTTGRSRENWLFDAAWNADGRQISESLIVRRDPEGGLLETDRSVEFSVLECLVDSAVPAPAPRWLDPSGDELGRPSLIMVRERGVCEYFAINGERPVERRLALAERFCELMASVHQVDHHAVGLDRVLSDPGPDAARAELADWETILRRDQLEPYPELELAIRWLDEHAPTSPGTTLVHGDFKPGNVLLDGDDIVALLDWELVHLGDPHEDLGWVTQPLRTAEHLIDDVWESEHLIAHYEAVTGRDVDRAAVDWWRTLACLKTAVMQVSGLRGYVEGRSDDPYQPSAPVLAALLDRTVLSGRA